MKFNLINLLYLFIRLAPIIVVTFFSLQFVFNRDFISIIYLSGLVIICIILISVGKVYSSVFPNRAAANEKTSNMLCKVFELTKNGPISNIPLGQTILGYSFFFLVYIINKNNVKPISIDTKDVLHTGGNDEIIKQNIPLFVILPLLIIGDLFWNVTYCCENFNTLFASLAIGSLFGFIWAGWLDTNSRLKDTNQGVCGNNRTCQIDRIDAKYSTYATGKEVDLSLFTVINNPICDSYKNLPNRSIYKCKYVNSPVAANTPTGTTIISQTDELKAITKAYDTTSTNYDFNMDYTATVTKMSNKIP